MFSGIQEILLITLIVLGIFLIPRMMNPRSSEKRMVVRPPVRKLSWAFRLGIVLSVLWPIVWVAYFKPWQQAAISFSIIGIGPVVVAWSVVWVRSGIKNDNSK